MNVHHGQAAATAARRAALVALLRREGITDEAVLAAIGSVPRERFVPRVHRHEAYANHPLPIGYGQTISQPYVVALMTSALSLAPDDRVLEIGCGSGYQAAVLAALGCEVYSVEQVAELAEAAQKTLADCGYERVRVRHGDGWQGWPEEAPFAAIVVTAAPTTVPTLLLDQLGPGGRMIVPVGGQGNHQELTLITRNADGGLTSRRLGAVRFVPMVGGNDPRSGGSG